MSSKLFPQQVDFLYKKYFASQWIYMKTLENNNKNCFSPATAGVLDRLFLREASSAIQRLTGSSGTAGDDAEVASQNLRWDLCLTMYLRQPQDKSQTSDNSLQHSWWLKMKMKMKQDGGHTCRGFPRSAGRRAGPDGAGGGSAPGRSRPTSERWGPSLPRRTSSEKLELARVDKYARLHKHSLCKIVREKHTQI